MCVVQLVGVELDWDELGQSDAGRWFVWLGCISRTNTHFAQCVVHRLIARRVSPQSGIYWLVNRGAPL